MKAFPQASSPGFSKLCAQHLLEAGQGMGMCHTICARMPKEFDSMGQFGVVRKDGQTNSNMAYRSPTNSFVQEAGRWRYSANRCGRNTSPAD